jgi:hypothetical protein
VPKTLQGWLQSVCLLMLAFFLGTITFYTLRYAPQLQPILISSASASGNLASAASHVNSITDAADKALPEVRKGVSLLWKHADRTLGHLDAATADSRAEQAEIATKTKGLLDAGTALLVSGKETVDSMQPLTAAATTAVNDIATVVKHADETLNGEQIRSILKDTSDSSRELGVIMKDARIVADHYEKQIMAPAAWWKRLIGIASLVGDMKALW